MVVPFGVSVGDFIAIVKLLREITKALQKHGGAQSHYQRTVQNLNIIQAILSQFESFTSRSGNATRINAIRGCAQSAAQEVNTFLKDIEKYKNCLGQSVPKRVLSAPVAKIKWARQISVRAAELGSFVDIQIRNIQALLDLDLSESTSASLSQHSQNDTKLSSLPTRDELQTFTSSLSHSLQMMGDDTAVRVNKMETEILRRLDLVEAAMKTSSTACATPTAIQQLKTTLDNIQKSQQSRVALESSARLLLPTAVPQVKIPTADSLLLFRHLLIEVQTVLQMYCAWFCTLLGGFILALPQVVLILRTMHRLPKAISLVLHDIMSFEDAIGRLHSLQYQQFRHWAVFESLLRCSFTNLPGSRKIMRGHFILTPEGAPTITLTAFNFAEQVKPGFTFKMSLTMKKLILKNKKCPRGCTGEVETTSPLESHCRGCGVRYLSGIIQSTSADKVGTAQVGDENQTQISQATGLRQDQSTDFSESNLMKRVTNTVGDRDDATAADRTLDEDLEERQCEVEEMQYFSRIHIEGIEQIERPGGRAIDTVSIERLDLSTSSTEEDSSNRNSVLVPPPIQLTTCTSPEDRLGCILGGRFKLLAILGIGAYGVIYQAVDILTDVPYAIKTLPKTGLTSGQRRFQRREIALHHQASQHPNVLSLLRIIDSPDCTFIVTELCPKGDLFSNITEQGRFVGDDLLAKDTFLQILDAVQYCHSIGIYHRDLRPENILVTNDKIVKLADFGLATTDITSDVGYGSDFYMSPEFQLPPTQGCPQFATAPNDVWSLGVILVNLTCGRNPWLRASPEDSAFRAFLKDPMYLSSMLPISFELNTILRRIFECDPHKRISLLELREAIVNCPRLTTTSDESSRTSS